MRPFRRGLENRCGLFGPPRVRIPPPPLTSGTEVVEVSPSEELGRTMELVTQKVVAPEEAYQKSVDKTSFEGLLKRAGIDTKFAVGVAP